VAEYFEAAAAENGQRIAINGEGSLRADRLLLRRALNNLLSNAVRYSPRDATISMELRAGPTGTVIAVSNPAQGLSEAELRRLFARFARRDSSRGRQLEGAGLGLAIVDSIMKLQGGSLDVASSSDTVTFELRFPSSKITNP
jgi:two-component system, OmpR family, heavy metal sensor histidine kinase CusS